MAIAKRERQSAPEKSIRVLLLRNTINGRPNARFCRSLKSPRGLQCPLYHFLHQILHLSTAQRASTPCNHRFVSVQYLAVEDSFRLPPHGGLESRVPPITLLEPSRTHQIIQVRSEKILRFWSARAEVCGFPSSRSRYSLWTRESS